MKKPTEDDRLAISELLCGLGSDRQADSKVANPPTNSKHFRTYEGYKRYLRAQNLSAGEYQRKIQQFCKRRGI